MHEINEHDLGEQGKWQIHLHGNDEWLLPGLPTNVVKTVKKTR